MASVSTHVFLCLKYSVIVVGSRPLGGNVRYSALDPGIALPYTPGSLVGYRRRNRPAVGNLPHEENLSADRL